MVPSADRIFVVYLDSGESYSIKAFKDNGRQSAKITRLNSNIMLIIGGYSSNSSGGKF